MSPLRTASAFDPADRRVSTNSTYQRITAYLSERTEIATVPRRRAIRMHRGELLELLGVAIDLLLVPPQDLDGLRLRARDVRLSSH